MNFERFVYQFTVVGSVTEDPKPYHICGNVIELQLITNLQQLF